MSLKPCGKFNTHGPHRWPLGSDGRGRAERYYCIGVGARVDVIARHTSDPNTPAVATEPAPEPALSGIAGDPTPDATEIVGRGAWVPMPPDKSLTYYLSGPMSGYPDFNHETFASTKEFLQLRGWKIVSPHELPVPEEPLSEYAVWRVMMERCSALLTTAGGIIMLRGWPQSRGARAELSQAMERSLPVYYLHGNILINMNNERIEF